MLESAKFKDMLKKAYGTDRMTFCWGVG